MIDGFLDLYTVNNLKSPSMKKFKYSTEFTGNDFFYLACYNLKITPSENYVVVYFDDALVQHFLNNSDLLKNQDIVKATSVFIVDREDTGQILNSAAFFTLKLRVTQQTQQAPTSILSVEPQTFQNPSPIAIAANEYIDFNLGITEEEEKFEGLTQIPVYYKFENNIRPPCELFKNFTFERTLRSCVKHLDLDPSIDYALFISRKKHNLTPFKEINSLESYDINEDTAIHVFPKKFTVHIITTYVNRLDIEVEATESVGDIVERICKQLHLHIFHDYTLKADDGKKSIELNLQKPIIMQTKQLESLTLYRRFFIFSREDIESLENAINAINDVRNYMQYMNLYFDKNDNTQMLNIIYYAVQTMLGPLEVKHFPIDLEYLFPNFPFPDNIIETVKQKFAKVQPPEHRENAARLFLREIRNVPGFGAKVFRAIYTDDEGVEHMNECNVVVTPIQLIIATDQIEKVNKSDDVYKLQLTYSQFRITSMSQNEVSIECQQNYESQYFEISLQILDGRVNEFYECAVETARIIKEIFTERQIRRSRGELISFSASYDRVELYTAKDIKDDKPQLFTYDRTLTGAQLAEEAAKNLKIWDGKTEFRVLLYGSTENCEWFEPSQLIASIDPKNRSKIIVTPHFIHAKIHFSDGGSKVILMDMTMHAGRIVEIILQKINHPLFLGFGLYTYEDGKIGVPIFNKYYIPSQVCKVTNFLFFRRVFVLSKDDTFSKITRRQVLNDAMFYLKYFDVQISLDRFWELMFLFNIATERPKQNKKPDVEVFKRYLPLTIEYTNELFESFKKFALSYEKIDSMNASNRFMKEVRKISDFGAIPFMCIFEENAPSSMMPDLKGKERLVRIGPQNLYLYISETDVAKISWFEIRYAKLYQGKYLRLKHIPPKSTETKIIYITCSDPFQLWLIESYRDEFIMTLKERNRNHKKYAKIIPKIEEQRIAGTYIDETGRRFEPQIDLYVGTNPAVGSNLDKVWFETRSSYQNIYNKTMDVLGLGSKERYILILYINRVSYVFDENHTLEDYTPPRESFLFMVRAERKIRYTYHGVQKKITTKMLADIKTVTFLACAEFSIVDPENFFLYVKTKGGNREMLDRSLMLCQQTTGGTDIYLSRFSFIISKDYISDAKYLREVYICLKDIAMSSPCCVFTQEKLMAMIGYSLHLEGLKPSDLEDPPTQFYPRRWEPQKNDRKLIKEAYKKTADKTLPEIVARYRKACLSLTTFSAEYYFVNIEMEGSQMIEVFIVITRKHICVVKPKPPTLMLEEIDLKSIFSMQTLRPQIQQHKMAFLAINFVDKRGQPTGILMESYEITKITNSILAKVDVIKSKLLKDIRRGDSKKINSEYDMPTKFINELNTDLEPYKIKLPLYFTKKDIIAKVVKERELCDLFEYELLISIGIGKYEIFDDSTHLCYKYLNDATEIILIQKYYLCTFTDDKGTEINLTVDISKPVKDIIPILGSAFNIDYYLGYMIVDRSGESEKILSPLQPLASQTQNFKKLYFTLMFFPPFTKYDMQLPHSKREIFELYKNAVLTQDLHLETSNVILFALLQHNVECRNNLEYDIKPKSFTTYLTKGMEDDPAYLKDLHGFISKFKYMGSDVAATKYIENALALRTIGIYKFKISLLEREKEKTVLSSCKIEISYNGIVATKSSGSVIFKCSLRDIRSVLICKDIIYIGSMDITKRQYHDITLRGEKAQMIEQILTSYLKYMLPLVDIREYYQENQKKYVDQVFKEDTITLNMCRRFDNPISIKITIEKNKPMTELLNAAGIFAGIIDTNNYVLFARAPDATTVFPLDIKQQIVSQLKDGYYFYLIARTKQIYVHLPVYYLKVLKEVDIRQNINDLIFTIMKENKLGISEGFTFQIRSSPNSLLTLDPYKPLYSDSMTISDYYLVRRVFIFSSQYFMDENTLYHIHYNLQEFISKYNPDISDEESSELQAINVFIQSREKDPYKKEYMKRVCPDLRFVTPESKVYFTDRLAEFKRDNDSTKALLRHLYLIANIPGFGTEKYECMFAGSPGYLVISPYKIKFIDHENNAVMLDVESESLKEVGIANNSISIHFSNNGRNRSIQLSAVENTVEAFRLMNFIIHLINSSQMLTSLDLLNEELQYNMNPPKQLRPQSSSEKFSFDSNSGVSPSISSPALEVFDVAEDINDFQPEILNFDDLQKTEINIVAIDLEQETKLHSDGHDQEIAFWRMNNGIFFLRRMINNIAAITKYAENAKRDKEYWNSEDVKLMEQRIKSCINVDAKVKDDYIYKYEQALLNLNFNNDKMLSQYFTESEERVFIMRSKLSALKDEPIDLSNLTRDEQNLVHVLLNFVEKSENLQHNFFMRAYEFAMKGFEPATMIHILNKASFELNEAILQFCKDRKISNIVETKEKSINLIDQIIPTIFVPCMDSNLNLDISVTDFIDQFNQIRKAYREVSRNLHYINVKNLNNIIHDHINGAKECIERIEELILLIMPRLTGTDLHMSLLIKFMLANSLNRIDIDKLDDFDQPTIEIYLSLIMKCRRLLRFGIDIHFAQKSENKDFVVEANKALRKLDNHIKYISSINILPLNIANVVNRLYELENFLSAACYLNKYIEEDVRIQPMIFNINNYIDILNSVAASTDTYIFVTQSIFKIQELVSKIPVELAKYESIIKDYDLPEILYHHMAILKDNIMHNLLRLCANDDFFYDEDEFPQLKEFLMVSSYLYSLSPSLATDTADPDQAFTDCFITIKEYFYRSMNVRALLSLTYDEVAVTRFMSDLKGKLDNIIKQIQYIHVSDFSNKILHLCEEAINRFFEYSATHKPKKLRSIPTQSQIDKAVEVVNMIIKRLEEDLDTQDFTTILSNKLTAQEEIKGFKNLLAKVEEQRDKRSIDLYKILKKVAQKMHGLSIKVISTSFASEHEDFFEQIYKEIKHIKSSCTTSLKDTKLLMKEFVDYLVKFESVPLFKTSLEHMPEILSLYQNAENYPYPIAMAHTQFLKHVKVQLKTLMDDKTSFSFMPFSEFDSILKLLDRLITSIDYLPYLRVPPELNLTLVDLNSKRMFEHVKQQIKLLPDVFNRLVINGNILFYPNMLAYQETIRTSIEKFISLTENEKYDELMDYFEPFDDILHNLELYLTISKDTFAQNYFFTLTQNLITYKKYQSSPHIDSLNISIFHKDMKDVLESVNENTNPNNSKENEMLASEIKLLIDMKDYEEAQASVNEFFDNYIKVCKNSEKSVHVRKEAFRACFRMLPYSNFNTGIVIPYLFAPDSNIQDQINSFIEYNSLSISEGLKFINNNINYWPITVCDNLHRLPSYINENCPSSVANFVMLRALAKLSNEKTIINNLRIVLNKILRDALHKMPFSNELYLDLLDNFNTFDVSSYIFGILVEINANISFDQNPYFDPTEFYLGMYQAVACYTDLFYCLSSKLITILDKHKEIDARVKQFITSATDCILFGIRTVHIRPRSLITLVELVKDYEDNLHSSFIERLEDVNMKSQLNSIINDFKYLRSFLLHTLYAAKPSDSILPPFILTIVYPMKYCVKKMNADSCKLIKAVIGSALDFLEVSLSKSKLTEIISLFRNMQAEFDKLSETNTEDFIKSVNEMCDKIIQDKDSISQYRENCAKIFKSPTKDPRLAILDTKVKGLPDLKGKDKAKEFPIPKRLFKSIRSIQTYEQNELIDTPIIASKVLKRGLIYSQNLLITIQSIAAMIILAQERPESFITIAQLQAQQTAAPTDIAVIYDSLISKVRSSSTMSEFIKLTRKITREEAIYLHLSLLLQCKAKIEVDNKVNDQILGLINLSKLTTIPENVQHFNIIDKYQQKLTDHYSNLVEVMNILIMHYLIALNFHVLPKVPDDISKSKLRISATTIKSILNLISFPMIFISAIISLDRETVAIIDKFIIKCLEFFRKQNTIKSFDEMTEPVIYQWNEINSEMNIDVISDVVRILNSQFILYSNLTLVFSVATKILTDTNVTTTVITEIDLDYSVDTLKSILIDNDYNTFVTKQTSHKAALLCTIYSFMEKSFEKGINSDLSILPLITQTEDYVTKFRTMKTYYIMNKSRKCLINQFNEYSIIARDILRINKFMPVLMKARMIHPNASPLGDIEKRVAITENFNIKGQPIAVLNAYLKFFYPGMLTDQFITEFSKTQQLLVRMMLSYLDGKESTFIGIDDMMSYMKIIKQQKLQNSVRTHIRKFMLERWKRFDPLEIMDLKMPTAIEQNNAFLKLSQNILDQTPVDFYPEQMILERLAMMASDIIASDVTTVDQYITYLKNTMLESIPLNEIKDDPLDAHQIENELKLLEDNERILLLKEDLILVYSDISKRPHDLNQINLTFLDIFIGIQNIFLILSSQTDAQNLSVISQLSHHEISVLYVMLKLFFMAPLQKSSINMNDFLKFEGFNQTLNAMMAQNSEVDKLMTKFKYSIPEIAPITLNVQSESKKNMIERLSFEALTVLEEIILSRGPASTELLEKLFAKAAQLIPFFVDSKDIKIQEMLDNIYEIAQFTMNIPHINENSVYQIYKSALSNFFLLLLSLCKRFISNRVKFYEMYLSSIESYNMEQLFVSIHHVSEDLPEYQIAPYRARILDRFINNRKMTEDDFHSVSSPSKQIRELLRQSTIDVFDAYQNVEKPFEPFQDYDIEEEDSILKLCVFVLKLCTTKIPRSKARIIKQVIQNVAILFYLRNYDLADYAKSIVNFLRQTLTEFIDLKEEDSESFLLRSTAGVFLFLCLMTANDRSTTDQYLKRERVASNLVNFEGYFKEFSQSLDINHIQTFNTYLGSLKRCYSVKQNVEQLLNIVLLSIDPLNELHQEISNDYKEKPTVEAIQESQDRCQAEIEAIITQNSTSKSNIVKHITNHISLLMAFSFYEYDDSRIQLIALASTLYNQINTNMMYNSEASLNDFLQLSDSMINAMNIIQSYKDPDLAKETRECLTALHIAERDFLIEKNQKNLVAVHAMRQMEEAIMNGKVSPKKAMETIETIRSFGFVFMMIIVISETCDIDQSLLNKAKLIRDILQNIPPALKLSCEKILFMNTLN